MFGSTPGRTFLIAEIGNNHEGDMCVARDLVLAAAETGVDAVKFQTFLPHLYHTVLDADRQARLEGFQLSFDQFAELAELAHGKDLAFISTPFDLESAAFLGEAADAIKIASGDNTFYPLIERVAESGKPMIISTGLADLDDIRRAEETVAAVWGRSSVDQDLALLHCLVSYPAPDDQVNLRAITMLKAAFPDRAIGYSDHTSGIDAARLAVALGATVIEKHFTLDNAYSDFRDHALSADPETMKAMVTAVRTAETLLGSSQSSGGIGVMPCEEPNRTAVRRSLTAARDLGAGTVLSAADLVAVRPGGGVPPGSEDQLIGRTLTSAVKQGEMVTPNLLVPPAGA